MRLFTSPEECKILFRKHRKMIADYAKTRENLQPIRFAILSGATTHPLRNILELVLLDSGFNPSFFEGDYNAFAFEARFSQALVDFGPDVVYFHTSIDNIVDGPDVTTNATDASARLSAIWSEFKGAAEAVLSRTKAQVILNSFEPPNYRISGNYEAVAQGGTVRTVNQINLWLTDFAQDNARVYLNDVAWLAAKVGLENWRDDKSYAAFKQPFTARAQAEIAQSLAGLTRALMGRAAKGLILDLDNTLWGGVIGDDGVDGVKIGAGDAKGEAYLAFQKALRPLLQRGIAFAVSSKNEAEIAIKGLNRNEMALRESDFHILRINWKPKSQNIVEIRQALNVGMEALIFIDDSAFERAEVHAALPELTVPEVEADPFSYLQALSSSYAFEVTTISKDDLSRGESFKAMANFAMAAESGTDMDAFLRRQAMRYTLSPLTDSNVDRVHQLINKTNQFNLTGQRLNLAEVEAFRDRGTLFAASLEDKATQYGLISVVWGEVEGDTFELANWVMSCRVFNRRLEHVIFLQLYRQLAGQGVTRIRARYLPTEKNKPVADLLGTLGLTPIGTENGATVYECDVPSATIEELSKMEELYL